jgi:Pretoxin HINT domain
LNAAKGIILILWLTLLASMGTVSALTPDTAATGPSSVAVAKEDTGQKSVTALESRRAEPRQTAGRHQGNGIDSYDFAPDSLLATQDGLRPIEQIRLGDWVWAYDETTGVNSLKEVVRTFARDTDWVVILEIGNEVVQATLEHPFWQDGIGWRRAGELTAGDRIQTISGVPATVTHAEHRLAPQPVFNIEVTDAHTYFVSPTKLLVHNACKVYAVKTLPTATQPNRIYSARELLRRAEEPGPFHNFPESFNKQIFESGNRTVTPDFFNKARTGLSNDSIQYRLPGTVNGRDGMFEIFTRPSTSGNTEVIMHRFLKPNP